MPVEIAGWTVHAEGAAPQRLSTGQLDLERHLEDWIARDPTLVEDGFVVGRQLRLDGGILDLLCLDAQGGLQVVEIKRGPLYRDTIAQAVDYAASLSVMPADDLVERIRKWLVDHPDSVAEARLTEQAHLDVVDQGRRQVGIVVVGTRRDPSLDRVAAFLGDGFGVPIRVVSFQVFDLPDGKKLLFREAAENEAPETPRSVAGYSWGAVLANAERAGVGPEMKRVHDFAENLGLFPRACKVSLMVTPVDDKRRYLFTFWPKENGNLGMIYSASALAEFHGVSEAAARAALGEENRSLTRVELEPTLATIEALLHGNGAAPPA
jgi:hypothetical protein